LHFFFAKDINPNVRYIIGVLSLLFAIFFAYIGFLAPSPASNPLIEGLTQISDQLKNLADNIHPSGKVTTLSMGTNKSVPLAPPSEVGKPSTLVPSGSTLEPKLTLPDLSFGPNQPDGFRSDGTSDSGKFSVRSASVDGSNKKEKDSTPPVGNLITCVPPNPSNYAWIWIYRLEDKNQWQRISKGIPSLNSTGYLKISGLPIDVSRFGRRGEPYRIEQVINNIVTKSVGNFQSGELEFRIFPYRDNFTSWQCPR
jgi:hypothetical protein